MDFTYAYVIVCLLNYMLVVQANSQNDCGKLKQHKSATCTRKERKCPNAYNCMKSKLDNKKFVCCRVKTLPSSKQCKRKAGDIVDEPQPCRGGGSVPCPEKYFCYTGRGNRFSLCCLSITCTDHQGLVHKLTDKKWKARDGCNTCKCGGQDKVVCTNKASCENKCAKSGEISWKDAGCTRCECKNKRLQCEEPCDRVENPGAVSPMSTCPEGCGWQASIQRCDGVQGENNKPCPAFKLQWGKCKPQPPELCPEPGVRLTESAPIVTGGVEVHPPYNYRWMVYFEPRDTCGCGGSIISPKHVLTAAHCVDRLRYFSDELTIFIGKHNLSITEPFQQTRKASKFIIHELYDSRNYDNDIAIIELDQPVKFNNITQPIQLPRSGEFDMNKIRKRMCTVIGWGSTSKNWPCVLSDVLLKADLTLVDQCFLENDDLFKVTDNMFCAGNGSKGKDSCFGDSGGPLMCREQGKDNKDKWIQYGIVSWGPVGSCGSRSGVYTKVTNYIDWILEKISTDGGWGEWSSFTPCRIGDNKKSRVRVCSNPPPIGKGTCSSYTDNIADKAMVQVEEENC